MLDTCGVVTATGVWSEIKASVGLGNKFFWKLFNYSFSQVIH
jgi:hypothetical protein